MSKTAPNNNSFKIWKLKLSIIGLIGIVSLTFSIIFTVLIIKEYKFSQSIKVNAKNILKDKSKNLYYLDFSGSVIADINYNNYLFSLNNTEGITSSGAFCTSSLYIKEFWENKDFITTNKKIRLNNTPDIIKDATNDNDMDDFYKITDTFIVSLGLFDLMDLDIYKGETVKNVSPDEIPVLVGYNYKDVIEIGQTFIASPNDTTYKIVGILNKNSSWINEGNLSEVGNHTTSSINLDNYFVMVYDNRHFRNNENVILNNPSTYVYTDNKDSLTNIKKLNKEYKQNYKAISMSDIYKDLDDNSIFNIKYEILRNNIVICLTLLCIILWIYIFKHKPDVIINPKEV